MGGGISNKSQTYDVIKSREIGLLISKKLLNRFMWGAGLYKICTLSLQALFLQMVEKEGRALRIFLLRIYFLINKIQPLLLVFL